MDFFFGLYKKDTFRRRALRAVPDIICLKEVECTVGNSQTMRGRKVLTKNTVVFSFFRITGTPSPLSPTPSPSGSVGSVGSNGSNETMTTPSRNGKPSSTSSAMTSPVNVCIPQKIHAMTQQHVLTANNLLYSQDTWDQSQPIVLEFRGKMMNFVLKIRYDRAFSLTWSAVVQIYWNQRNVFHKKKDPSLEHQHGRRLIVLVHQYGGRNVMCGGNVV